MYCSSGIGSLLGFESRHLHQIFRKGEIMNEQRELNEQELKEESRKVILANIRSCVLSGEIDKAYNLSVIYSNLKD